MIRTDLGIATAYAEAVSKGYTGTRDEFGQMFADFGKTAEKVTEDKKAVEQMKASVEETKSSVDTTAAEFGQNVADKTAEAKAAITEHANTEKESATAAISEAKDAATGAITEAQTSATDAIASAKDSATAEITKKGTDTLATIPEDYTALTGQVDSLKEDIDNVIQKQPSKNLYNQAEKMDGYQLYRNGTPALNSEYNFTGYINVDGNDQITVTLSGFSPIGANTQNAFYDSNKLPITKRNEAGNILTGTPTTFNVPDAAKYFGIAYIANQLSPGSTIMVCAGNIALPYEPYGSTIKILSSDETKEARGGYSNLGDRLDSLTPLSQAKKLIYWGDSLTEGNQAADGGSVPGTMQTLLGSEWEVLNFGRGGDRSNSIACRQGGMNFIIKPNQTIPSSGSVILDIEDNFGNDVAVRLYATNSVNNKSLNPCYIDGIKGTLMRGASNYPLNKAEFTREESGDAVTLTRPTAVISNGATEYRGYPCVIYVGQNEGFDTSKPSELLGQVKNMVRWANTDKYLIIGLCHQTGYTWQVACNDLLREEFGRKFIDIEKYLKTPVYDADTIVSSYAMSDENITPTEEDLEKISKNNYPSSIMYDGIHFNKYGYECIAKLEYKRGKELGYW